MLEKQILNCVGFGHVLAEIIMNQHPIWKHIDENADRLRALSDSVWAVPETCYGEHKSVALHIDELEDKDFVSKKRPLAFPQP